MIKKILLILIILIIIILFNNDDYLKFSPKLTKTDIINIKKGQNKMTKMLETFDKICIKYNLKYWCCGGTLIGILHSNKWLPWDGDIDVCMLYDDYVKLEKIIQKELPNTMWFQSSKTDKYFKRPDKNKSHLPSKIRDLNSCYLNCQDALQWHNGLQIDISTYKKKQNKLISDSNVNDYIDYDYDFIFPLKRSKFDGIDVYIPNKYKEYSIKNWKHYPPKYSPISERYPHEGKIQPNKTCDHHYKLYKNFYN